MPMPVFNHPVRYYLAYVQQAFYVGINHGIPIVVTAALYGVKALA